MNRLWVCLAAGVMLGAGCVAVAETARIEAPQVSLAGKAILASPDLRQAITNKTIRYYDPGHGTQIEYYDAAGTAHLWYPGNKINVESKWDVREGEAGKREICFVFPSAVYNPVTKAFGGKQECQLAEIWALSVQESADGDVFNLASAKPPWVLGKSDVTTIESAQQRLAAP
jgi:hypothetical protein